MTDIITAGHLTPTPDWQRAESIQDRNLQNCKNEFQQEDPNTIQSMVNLGSTYYYQHKWNEAGELYLKLLPLQQKSLGKEHPDTIQSMANLGAAYWYQHRWKEAKKLYLQLLPLQKKVLGGEDSNTTVLF